MNLFSISWKNILHKPTSVVLSLVLFALGVGLIAFLLQVDKQVQQKFENNLAGIDLVVGAKGSPLQLILSSMYHIDAPTGNISLEQARPFLNPQHPLVDLAVPLSLGDSYKGYRIVGTTHDILDLYGIQLPAEMMWQENFEVTAGAGVARKLNLSVGDVFQSSHGFTDDIHSHDQDLKIVGILEPTNTVVDQLLLTTPATFWKMHNHAEDETGRNGDTGHNHNGNNHNHNHEHEHEHNHNHNHDHKHENGNVDSMKSPESIISSASNTFLLQQGGNQEITSLLLTFKGRNFQALNLGRNINENTDMQAASPAIEINRLFSLMDTGTQALNTLALAIVFVSGLSIFLAMLNKLRDRKLELAYMRVKGASRTQVFMLIIFEGLIIAFLGSLLGFLLSYGGLYFLSESMETNYNYSLSAGSFSKAELYLFFSALGLGVIAALIPAIQASKTDISITLEGN